MRRLARTLLILGSVSACERAQPIIDDRKPLARPVVDGRGAPAVGNIGQSGRPTVAAHAEFRAGASVPLVDGSGAPAVGNIGQSGAPNQTQREHRERRVQRAQRAGTKMTAVPRPELPPSVPPAASDRRALERAAKERAAAERAAAAASAASLSIEASPQPSVALRAERPLLNGRERPAVGNCIGKCGKGRSVEEGAESGTPGERARMAFELGRSVSRPLFDRREQPMVGNVGREGRAGPRTPRQKLAALARHIRDLEQQMNEAPTEQARDEWKSGLGKALDQYVELERKLGSQEDER